MERTLLGGTYRVHIRGEEKSLPSLALGDCSFVSSSFFPVFSALLFFQSHPSVVFLYLCLLDPPFDFEPWFSDPSGRGLYLLICFVLFLERPLVLFLIFSRAKGAGRKFWCLRY
jgi:hypothetical protein